MRQNADRWRFPPPLTPPRTRGSGDDGRAASVIPHARRSERHPPSATTYGTGMNGASAADSATGPAPGPPPPCGVEKVLCRLMCMASTPRSPGPHLADDGVEVGAVGVEEGAGRVHGLGDRHHVALEQPAGVGVGQHDGGDVGREPLPHLLRVDACRRRAPARSRRGSRAAPRSPGWCRAPTPAPARPSASRRAPPAPP